MSILTQVGGDASCECDSPSRAGVRNIHHKEEHESHSATADQHGEVEEERESLTGCFVGRNIVGDDVDDAESYKRGTQVDQHDTSCGGAQAAR